MAGAVAVGAVVGVVVLVVVVVVVVVLVVVPVSDRLRDGQCQCLQFFLRDSGYGRFLSKCYRVRTK